MSVFPELLTYYLEAKHLIRQKQQLKTQNNGNDGFKYVCGVNLLGFISLNSIHRSRTKYMSYSDTKSAELSKSHLEHTADENYF